MQVQADPGTIVDDRTLMQKIDVLFDNAATQSQSITPKGHIRVIDARNDIMEWGESEFGLSNGEKQVLDEIYGEIDSKVVNSFSKQELFRHLKDTCISLDIDEKFESQVAQNEK